MTAPTFNRPGYLAPISNDSPVGRMLVRTENAAANADAVEFGKCFEYWMMNMGGCGASGREMDGDIAEYLDQFDEIFA